MNQLVSVTDSFFRAWFRFHPEVAVDLGVPGYEHLLRPYDQDQIGALISLNEKLLHALAELDENTFSPDQQIDIQLLQGMAILELEELAERDWRYTNPARFLPVNAIYQLTVRRVEDPARAWQTRLKDIPGYLRGARSLLLTEPVSIPALWLESAIQEARAGVDFFRELESHELAQRYRVSYELEQAAHALDEFVHFMEKELQPLASGDVACGEKYFHLLLQHRHFLDATPQELYAFGERLFAQTRQDLEEETLRLQGNKDVLSLLAKIQASQPERTGLIDAYQREMFNARAFVTEHQLVTLPAMEELRVVETPGFLQHQIPFAAYHEPSPTDHEQHGIYYVTPPRSEDAWAEHHLLSIKHTAVHEAWPGHHLQFVTANGNAASRSMARLVNPSATLYEGWALYCEEMMQEQGFLDAVESRFILLRDRLWRALRVMIDVGIHTGSMTVEQAMALLQQHLGFTPEQARGELTWYSQAPGVPMGYATGWALIRALRHEEEQLPVFSLKNFHDQLIGAGSMALSLAIEKAFGVQVWHRLQQKIFEKN